MAEDLEALQAEAIRCQRAGDAERAEALYRRLLVQAPSAVAALNNLAVLLDAQGNTAEARALLLRAVALKPGQADHHANLAKVEKKMGHAAAAVIEFAKALQCRPDHAEALLNFANLLHDQGDLATAEALYREAIRLRPEWALARFNLGMALLLAGRMAEGWREYAHRWRLDDVPIVSARAHYGRLPRWQGEDLAGRTLLLHGEQGYGDSIQFVRYVPLLVERGARVIVDVPRALMRLLATVPGAPVIAHKGEPPPPADCWAGLLDVPGLLGETTIPVFRPYLAAAGAARPSGAGSLRVGLVWAGNPGHENDALRSLRLADLFPLLQVPGVRFSSLQLGSAARQLDDVPAALRPEDRTNDIRDFADTAARLAALDLLICVDTAVAHLAGALGLPVWIILPPNPDWRWQLEREDSPWYPTARLFRRRWRQPLAPFVTALAEALAVHTA